MSYGSTEILIRKSREGLDKHDIYQDIQHNTSVSYIYPQINSSFYRRKEENQKGKFSLRLNIELGPSLGTSWCLLY